MYSKNPVSCIIWAQAISALISNSSPYCMYRGAIFLAFSTLVDPLSSNILTRSSTDISIYPIKLVLFVTASKVPDVSPPFSGSSSGSSPGSSSVGGSSTVTAICTLDDAAPSSSFTLSVAVYSPASSYTCTGSTPLPVFPSPKFQIYSAISPSESVDPEPSNRTSSPVMAV